MTDKSNSRIWLAISVLLSVTLCTTVPAKTIYVDADAAGANNGSSWQNAYVYLQEALAAANLSEKPVEIRVAQGVYRPNQGLVAIPEFDWRTTTFQLVSGVAIKGGYAGLGQPDPNARNVELYETILSGDLNGNDADVADPCDLLNEPTRADNSYHVVTGSGTDLMAILDGFSVTGGNALNNEGKTGGGILNMYGNPTLNNCTVKKNIAVNGGGMFNSYSSPTLNYCVFQENSADRCGGMQNANSSPALTNCIFRRNYSYRTGGGMYNNRSDTLISNCLFTNNRARFYGGGIENFLSSPNLVNCIFSGNVGSSGGGAIFCTDSDPALANCAFVGNTGQPGNAFLAYSMTSGSHGHVVNCIFRDGGDEISNDGPSIVEVAYSNVQGGWIGEGNIGADPFFAEPGRWADVNDPNVVVEPNDPNAAWVDGDYHLKSQAGRWEPVSKNWVMDDVTSPCIDTGDPNSPVGDEPQPNGGRINMGVYGGTAEASKSPSVASPIVYIQWLGHSSVKLWAEDCIVYVDPQRLSISPHDATLVLVTHTHGDHYSPTDIARVSNDQTKFVAPPDVVRQYGKGENIAPGQTIESYCARLTGVASYNTNKSNHPKSNNWVGYIVELGGKRIYVAGDTDLIEEMKSLGEINVAILPAGGTYTMNAVEAAEATQYIKPDLAIPYHWGQNVGTIADAQTFAQLARCAVKIMTVGETISSDNWPVYSPLIAHWKLDETADGLAQDSAGDFDGTLHGGPAWLPAGGKKTGALQLDGVDDYVSTPFVSNPADGAFSAFAWVKGGAPGQVILSQTDGAGSGEIWLGVEPLQGKLMTGLIPPPSGRTATPALKSDFIITDGQWHHIGFAWDGSRRHLYADGAEIAKDAAAVAPLKSSNGGLYIGAGKTPDAGTFWLGLLDEIRIYNRALDVAEIGDLAH